MRPQLAALLAGALLSAPAAAAEAALDVRAANAPLAALAAFIAGDAAAVSMLLPEGADPAVWQPGIADLTALQGADLIVLNGAGFEPWAERVSLPRARVVDTSQSFADRFIPVEGVTHSHGEEPEHAHGAVAPNTWLDFTQAAAQASEIADALARADPDAAPAFQARLGELQAELDALDARAMSLGAALEGRTLLAQHRGLEYLARRYGLDIRTGAWNGSASTPAEVAELGATLDATPVDIVLWQYPPGPAAEAELAARGVASVLLDSGASVDPERFLPGMAENLETLEAAAARVPEPEGAPPGD